MKEEKASFESENKMLQSEVNKRDLHIQELHDEIGGLKNQIVQHENMILHRNTEEIKRLNQEIKQIETEKEFEENRLKTLVKTFELKVDQMTKDNFMMNEKLLWVFKNLFYALIFNPDKRWRYVFHEFAQCLTFDLLPTNFNSPYLMNSWAFSTIIGECQRMNWIVFLRSF